jgi:hypothetical protein
VSVTDRGRGIPEADIDRVFDRFYRAVEGRTEPGSGPGLSIVDNIVRSHGGRVFVRARRDGAGTEIGFTLPVSKAPGTSIVSKRAHRRYPEADRDEQHAFPCSSSCGQWGTDPRQTPEYRALPSPMHLHNNSDR